MGKMEETGRVKTCLSQRWNCLGNSLFRIHWMGTKAVGVIRRGAKPESAEKRWAYSCSTRTRTLPEMETHALLQATIVSFCKTHTEGTTCCLLNNPNSAIMHLFRFSVSCYWCCCCFFHISWPQMCWTVCYWPWWIFWTTFLFSFPLSVHWAKVSVILICGWPSFLMSPHNASAHWSFLFLYFTFLAKLRSRWAVPFLFESFTNPGTGFTERVCSSRSSLVSVSYRTDRLGTSLRGCLIRVDWNAFMFFQWD